MRIKKTVGILFLLVLLCAPSHLFAFLGSGGQSLGPPREVEITGRAYESATADCHG